LLVILKSDIQLKILSLAVDGGYGDWSSYSECSAECGNGFPVEKIVTD